MGIQKINVDERLPKLLPSIQAEPQKKHRLSKADESFYLQYSAINQEDMMTKAAQKTKEQMRSQRQTFKELATIARKKS